MQWLRRRFLAGLFVTLPVIASVAALVWIFRVIDGFTSPIYARLLGRPVPGLGLLTTAVAVLLVGVVATNVIGRRLLQRVEHWLMLVPVFKTVYAPIKQLVLAFSPDNEYGFKQVVLVEDPERGYVMGFLTREFTLAGPEPGAGAACRVRPDEPPVPRGRADFPPGSPSLPRSVGGRGRPDLPDRRHGAARTGRGPTARLARQNGSMRSDRLVIIMRLCAPDSAARRTCRADGELAADRAGGAAASRGSRKDS